jgi:outer membrane protein assembly factor BamB
MKRQRLGALLACTALLFTFSALIAADKEKSGKEPVRSVAEQVDAEVASRAVSVPPQMDLDLEWYSPHIDVKATGPIIKGWVIKDLVLLETEKHFLVGVRRADGYERWRCELEDAIRYAPSVSQNNVVVNVKNFLVGIEKNGGDIRWRLMPNFVMSTSPLVVDPPAYPKEYTRKWQPMESIYAGSWDGRIYSMIVRGRTSYYVQHQIESENFSAPEFDLYYAWHKSSPIKNASVTQPIELRDNLLYYTSEDQNIYAVSRDGETRDPYGLQDAPTTTLTVTPSTSTQAGSIYEGAANGYVYCLDRLTLKKKWSFASGYPVTGSIFADEPKTPYVYAATNDGMLHALEVTPSKSSKGSGESPETFEVAWELPGNGVVTAGPDYVYVGLKRTAGFPAFQGIEAVDKSNGKVKWKVEGGFFTHFLEYQNAWSKPGSEARVYAITADNRVVSLREKIRDTGVRVVKDPEKAVDPSAPVKITGKKAGGDDAPKADAPKPDEAPKKE